MKSCKHRPEEGAMGRDIHVYVYVYIEVRRDNTTTSLH